MGGLPLFVEGGPGFVAEEVDGVCGSERGWETPEVLDDCEIFGWSIEIEGGAATGPALGVVGTVDA